MVISWPCDPKASESTSATCSSSSIKRSLIRSPSPLTSQRSHYSRRLRNQAIFFFSPETIFLRDMPCVKWHTHAPFEAKGSGGSRNAMYLEGLVGHGSGRIGGESVDARAQSRFRRPHSPLRWSSSNARHSLHSWQYCRYRHDGLCSRRDPLWERSGSEGDPRGIGTSRSPLREGQLRGGPARTARVGVLRS